MEKQNQTLETLLAPLTSLDAKASAASWIIPQYRPLFEREGAIIEMSPAAQNHLAHLVSKALGVSVGSLEESWGSKSDSSTAASGGLVIDYEPWHEAVNGADRAEANLTILKTHLYLREEEFWVLALFPFICGLMDHTTILPNIAVTSPMNGAGKRGCWKYWNGCVARR